MNELHLFAGAGGGILGGMLLGHRTVCAVEIEPYCRKVLLQRQRDGILPWFPIWDDVQTFNGKPWRGIADVVCGGFPCQDISIAGSGKGTSGERSGLWREMARIIGEIRPRFAFVENSPVLTSRGLGRVLGDLAEMGYDARWGVFGACSVGGVHHRHRIFILANDNGFRCDMWRFEREGVHRENKTYNEINTGIEARTFTNSISNQWDARGRIPRTMESPPPNKLRRHTWSKIASKICGVDDDVANHVDKLKALGNGQVPIVAATAWEILSDVRETGE